MATITRSTALALFTSIALMAGSAAADQPKLRLIAPAPGFDLPKFGFHSFNIANYGERITHVRWGGLASQLGLEPGDTILRLNGYPLTYHGAWRDALYRAMTDGGWIRLAIRDVRSGRIAHRQTFLGSPGYGPITPKSHAAGHAGPSPDWQHGNQWPDSSAGIGHPMTAKSQADPTLKQQAQPEPGPLQKSIAHMIDND
jgi:hypothetical protein